jgi:hypothetical protein
MTHGSINKQEVTMVRTTSVFGGDDAGGGDSSGNGRRK